MTDEQIRECLRKWEEGPEDIKDVVRLKIIGDMHLKNALAEKASQQATHKTTENYRNPKYDKYYEKDDKVFKILVFMFDIIYISFDYYIKFIKFMSRDIFKNGKKRAINRCRNNHRE